jgi:hypothetical protein
VCAREWRERESCNSSSLAAIAAAASAAKESWELSLSEVILLLHVFVVILSLYISNNMDSPVDVGGFAEPR